MAKENKEKCAYWITDNKCDILTRKKCTNCSFRITASELLKKKKRTVALLGKRFTKEEQNFLNAKYLSNGINNHPPPENVKPNAKLKAKPKRTTKPKGQSQRNDAPPEDVSSTGTAQGLTAELEVLLQDAKDAYIRGIGEGYSSKSTARTEKKGARSVLTIRGDIKGLIKRLFYAAGAEAGKRIASGDAAESVTKNV